MEEDYSELAQKCLEFSNQFKYSSHFNFSVNFDTFSFTVTHSKSRKSDEETQGRKKYVSPSNRRRNQQRLKAFLEKKAQHCEDTPSSVEDAKLDTSQSSPSNTTSNNVNISNVVSNTNSNTTSTQLSPAAANTENIVTYTEEDFIKKIKTKFTCDICGIHFDKSKNLKKHNNKYHHDFAPIDQMDGNTSLVENSTNITNCLENFSRTTKYTCDPCGMHFSKIRNLKKHNKKHHLDNTTIEQTSGNTSFAEKMKVFLEQLEEFNLKFMATQDEIMEILK